jgi:gliding motility-associated-like protein
MKTSKAIKTFICLLTLFLFVFPFSNISGQITAPSRDYADTTTYSDSPQDSIFIFKSTNTNIALVANGGSNSSFVWAKFNATSYQFDTIVSATKDTLTLDIHSAGGYRVYISGASGNSVYTAWVFIDSLYLKLEKDTSLGTDSAKVYRKRYTCSYLDLYYTFSQPNFKYYDLRSSDFDTLHWDSQLSMVWTSDQSVTMTASSSSDHTRLRYPSIPAKDTHFTLTVSDVTGLSVSDIILYISIETKAVLTVNVKDSKYVEGATTTLDSTYEYSAPVKATFYNTSINGSSYIWTLNDTTISGKNFNFTKTDTSYTDTTYLYPKTYKVKLISVSAEKCTDSVSTTIIVAQSEIEFPNVFTPDGSGVNDMFKPDFNSLVYFKITIYNRWGRVVHEFDGDVNDWSGWDGKTKLGLEASPGVYFFIVVPKGYGKIKAADPTGAKQYKGFVYLFR